MTTPLDSRDGAMYNPATFTTDAGGTLARTETELLDNPVGGRLTLVLRPPDFHSFTRAAASALSSREGTLDVQAPRA